MVSEEYHGALCKEVGAEFEVRVPKPIYNYRIKGKDYPAPYEGVLKTMIGQASRDDAEVERVWRGD